MRAASLLRVLGGLALVAFLGLGPAPRAAEGPPLVAHPGSPFLFPESVYSAIGVLSPDGQRLFVSSTTGPGGAGGREPLTVFDVAPDGALRLAGVFPSPDSGGGGLAVHPAGNTLYAVLRHANQVAVYRVSPGGALTQVQAVHLPAPGNSLNGVALASFPEGHFLYVINDLDPNVLSTFRVNPEGTLTAASQTPTGGNGGGVGVAGSRVVHAGRRLFVLNAPDSSVSVFDLTDGASPRLVPGSPFAVEGLDRTLVATLAVNPAGTALYVGDFAGGLAELAVRPDGALEARGTHSFGFAEPFPGLSSLHVDPTGRFLVGVFRNNPSVAVLDTTSLTHVSGSPVRSDSASSPQYAAFDATGARLFVTNGENPSAADISIYHSRLPHLAPRWRIRFSGLAAEERYEDGVLVSRGPEVEMSGSVVWDKRECLTYPGEGPESTEVNFVVVSMEVSAGGVALDACADPTGEACSAGTNVLRWNQPNLGTWGLAQAWANVPSPTDPGTVVRSTSVQLYFPFSDGSLDVAPCALRPPASVSLGSLDSPFFSDLVSNVSRTAVLPGGGSLLQWYKLRTGSATLEVEFAPAAGATPAGAGVAVQAQDTASGSPGPVVLTFETVTAPGVTTVTTSDLGAPSPRAFTLGSPPLFHDVTTTATFSGPVEVCVHYGGSTFTDETTLRLFHRENNAWEDVTTRHDIAAKTLCGQVASLSPFAVFQGPQAVSIDILPGDAPPANLSLRSRGQLPVAILGTPQLDVASVDPGTVTLAEAPVSRRGGGRPAASLEDVNGDGRQDLVLHFERAALRLAPSDTQAVLVGQLRGGRSVQGTDAVRVRR